MENAADLIEIGTNVGAWATKRAHVIARVIPLILVAIVPGLVPDRISTGLSIVDRINSVSF
jgi:hypothetical protein